MQKEEIAFLLCGLIQLGFCGKTTRIAQRPTNILLDFNAYRHISILHFVVPENSASANFKFVAKEEKLSGIGSCSPRDVSVFLKYGSIPFVQPDGAKIKAKILKERRHHYSLKILSNGDEHLKRIDAPPPGDWYAIAFRSWSDPDNGKITQAGIGVFCDTTLDADLSIEIPDKLLMLLDEKNDISIQLTKKNDSAIIQFPSFQESEPMFLNFTSSCGNDCLLIAQITARKQLASIATNNSATSLKFHAYDKNLHYATFRLFSGNLTNITMNLSEDDVSLKNISYVKLVRKSLPDFFLFDYEHLNDDDSNNNNNKATPLNLTSGILSIFKFHIDPIYDIGGTLTIGLKVTDSEAKKKKNILLIGCVSLGYYSDITSGASCVREEKSTPPDIVGNETSPSFIHVPYPEPGIWYLTVKAFKSNENCHCAKNCTEFACDECNCIGEIDLRIESSISSSSCVEGSCNDRGRCVQYMSGGFVFSACHCFAGYRGFDCDDDTYVLDNNGILLRVLTLTLSNLAFLGSIYIAIRRQYYTEAIVYSGVLIFSSFYHACEAGENLYTFCLMRLSVLQFCDFFNALLSIWVTLIAMASFGQRLTNFFQMTGAIVLAICAELDRTALWVFLLPTITGCTLVIISWLKKCRSRKTFKYPARPYGTIHLGIGLALVILGLVCYAFLQTRKNYFIVHSFWHICVAVGVMLLLPKRKYMQ
ncbi:transmembrane protein 8B [Leptopilina boulardi]|uniref:transmembrane protein 8B n=1 Tax=Leptopilina boulardi TaxID=63433 RepID=UPI0021F56154|nr:transmembrane protein 8B [Leptopilina boulardi]XP_051160938.1 transmembrane protein 8B [Leptopilina boulardi]